MRAAFSGTPLSVRTAGNCAAGLRERRGAAHQQRRKTGAGNQLLLHMSHHFSLPKQFEWISSSPRGHESPAHEK